MIVPKSHNCVWVCSVQHPQRVYTPVPGVFYLYVSSACLGNSCGWELIRMAMVLQGTRPALLHPLPFCGLCCPCRQL